MIGIRNGLRYPHILQQSLSMIMVNRLTQVHSENGRLSLYIVCVRPKNNDFPNVV